MVLNSPNFVGWAFPMLPRLVDHGGRQELRGVELAYSEPLQPRLLAAGETVQLRPLYVPHLDVDPVGTALTEQKHRHHSSLAA
jgi:hypothetical protein